jgi:pSer/pThr/pTyr-binding forkhead associated (FHA) protein
MRIEVMAGQDEPQIFPLNRPSLLLGSGEMCDIIIVASGVSRKHILIGQEDDSFYVIDQGSTNGSYINEERLVPGRRTEFTSFFPVRLGDDILVSLISDADDLAAEESSNLDSVLLPPKEPKIPVPSRHSATLSQSDATTRISLKDLQRARAEKKTEKLIQRRESLQQQKAKVKPKTKDQSRMTLTKLLASIILAGALYYQFYIKEEVVVQTEPVAQVGEVVELVQETPPAPEINRRLIPQDELLPRERLLKLLMDIKCTTEIETYLCELIPGTREGYWGVLQVGTMIAVLIDGSSYLAEARGMLVNTAASRPEDLPDSLRLLAMAIFLNRYAPGLDYQRLEEQRITIVFFEPEQRSITQVFAIQSSALQQLTQALELRFIQSVPTTGAMILKFIEDYGVFY